MNAWTVELRLAAKRGLRAIEEGPRQAAVDLLKDLIEDPALVNCGASLVRISHVE